MRPVPLPAGCRISSEMRHENAARFSNLRQEKGCALLLNPKDSSNLVAQEGGRII